MVYERIGPADLDCGALAEDKDYERQTGSGGIGRSVCCGDAGGDGARRGYGCGEGEDAAAASCRAAGHQPDGHGRGHCFAPPGFTGLENASDWPEYVAVRSRGREVLAHLQTLYGRLA